MKFTKFTRTTAKKDKEINKAELASELVKVLAEKGFITEVKEVKSNGFSLSKNKASFFIDEEKLGTNLRPASGTLTKYKRTNIPTWEERVEYNLTIQEFINEKGLSCKITSGCFIIKDHERDYTEYDWHNQNPAGSKNIIKCYPEYDAEEKAARKAHRNANKPIPCNAEKFIMGIKKRKVRDGRETTRTQESNRGTDTESSTDGSNPI